jgi:hypothetical protein
MVRLYKDGGEFFGMGEVMSDGRLVSRRLLAHDLTAQGNDLPVTQLSL